jgi:hypothetical protein
MFLEWIARKLIDRFPRLERLSRWQGWLLVAFIVSFLAYMVTRSLAFLVISVSFAVGTIFARAAWRRMEQPFRDDDDPDD